LAVEEIYLPDSITVIGSRAFSGLTSLKKFILPSKIGNSAFENCSMLTGRLVIPSNVKELPNYMISGCKNLKELIIKNKINSLGMGKMVNVIH